MSWGIFSVLSCETARVALPIIVFLMVIFFLAYRSACCERLSIPETSWAVWNRIGHCSIFHCDADILIRQVFIVISKEWLVIYLKPGWCIIYTFHSLTTLLLSPIDLLDASKHICGRDSYAEQSDDVIYWVAQVMMIEEQESFFSAYSYQL